MGDSIRISVRELAELSAMLLRGYERQVATVTIDHDYYWSIAAEGRYDVTVEPASFTVGQVTEDLDSLRQVVKDEAVTARCLVWLGRLLEAVGETGTETGNRQRE